MMQVNTEEFARRTAEGRPCGHYDFSLYYGLPFSCACGRGHDLKPWLEIVCELPLFRFVVACPEGGHLTVLKARWDRQSSRRQLEADFGTRLDEPAASRRGIGFQKALMEVRTGRSWTHEETAVVMEHQLALARLRQGC